MNKLSLAKSLTRMTLFAHCVKVNTICAKIAYLLTLSSPVHVGIAILKIIDSFFLLVRLSFFMIVTSLMNGPSQKNDHNNKLIV
jgi:hypothetical protein